MSSTRHERMTEPWFQLSNTAGRSSEKPERSSNSTPSAIACTIPNSIALWTSLTKWPVPGAPPNCTACSS
jgi:hypothetical protein